MMKKRPLRMGMVIAVAAMTIGFGVAWMVQTDAIADRLNSDREFLHSSDNKLDGLNDSFQRVSRAVSPSVVQIAVKATPDSQPMGLRQRGMDRDQLEEFFKRLPPEFRERFRNMPDRDSEGNDGDAESRDGDFRKYNVPRVIGAGSGWIYDDQGHIVTNNHVVERADTIEVIFHDKSKAEAKVIGTDERTDIAVLKVDKDKLYPALRAKQPVKQGEIVFAFGSPFRYAFSMSQGIVSGMGRQVGILGPGGYEDFIQTDAAINPGNSGGPLVNVRGEVVGMNTAIASRTGQFGGIGFAIPVNMIDAVVSELLDKGAVQRGYLGAFISHDPDMLRSFGVKQGVYIDDLIDGSPAKTSGLKRGDVVTHVDGKQVTTSDELRNLIASKDPGDKVKLTIKRDGKTESVNVTLGALPSEDKLTKRQAQPDGQTDNASMQALRKLGFDELTTLTQQLANQYKLNVESGVLVTKVRPGSAAAARGITAGMVITHVTDQKVDSLEALSKVIRKHDLSKGVRLSVTTRDGRSTFVFLKLSD